MRAVELIGRLPASHPATCGSILCVPKIFINALDVAEIDQRLRLGESDKG